MDVYEPSSGPHIHDLNPSSYPPTGLFWTEQIPLSGVAVDLDTGSATMAARNAPIIDYGSIGNALFGGGPTPVPGSVSFRVEWSGVNERVKIRNTDSVYGGFAGEFVRNSARMEWTARVGDLSFVSDPIGTSSSGFAELGHERNGMFFP